MAYVTIRVHAKMWRVVLLFVMHNDEI